LQEKKTLTEKADETTRRLSRASKLTVALADEQVRWTASVASLDKQIDDLVGNV
jgi:dynein heavy chain